MPPLPPVRMPSRRALSSHSLTHPNSETFVNGPAFQNKHEAGRLNADLTKCLICGGLIPDQFASPATQPPKHDSITGLAEDTISR